ncbi:hypothetical protein QQ045_004070 [Rhodiola kirilowii]
MGKTTTFVPSFFITISIIIRLISYVSKLKLNHNLPSELSLLDIATKFSVDPFSTDQASTDFGHMMHHTPAAVFYPSSVHDIVSLVKFSYNSSTPFTIAAKGHGHSTKGQAMAPDGVVLEMASLSRGAHPNNGIKIQCSDRTGSGCYIDVGGGKLWIDVLMKSIEDGLAPVSWTDYLYLSIGGTLSNGGISGQTFLHGPQISNVLEMDVVTGKGDFMTCSEGNNTELFNAVLGGLGQFGIITRARIPLKPAPKRVKWARMLYSNFSEFTKDQERLISLTRNGVDYVEGSLIIQKSSISNWRSSFFSPADHQKIIDLVKSHGIIYCLEVVKYYDDQSVYSIDKDLQQVFQDMSYVGELVYTKDVSFVEFLNRVRSGELSLKSKGLWDVPHPWLNLYVPKSSINDFNDLVFKNIILRHQKNISISTGPILIYPTLRSKWDVMTSAVVPDEDIFFCVGFLHSSGFDDWRALDDQNSEILKTCDRAGLKVKQYLPHYKTQQEWKKHFGPKWKSFQKRKAMFDPKAILSPGQRIF